MKNINHKKNVCKRRTWKNVHLFKGLLSVHLSFYWLEIASSWIWCFVVLLKLELVINTVNKSKALRRNFQPMKWQITDIISRLTLKQWQVFYQENLQTNTSILFSSFCFCFNLSQWVPIKLQQTNITSNHFKQLLLMIESRLEINRNKKTGDFSHQEGSSCVV